MPHHASATLLCKSVIAHHAGHLYNTLAGLETTNPSDSISKFPYIDANRATNCCGVSMTIKNKALKFKLRNSAALGPSLSVTEGPARSIVLHSFV